MYTKSGICPKSSTIRLIWNGIFASTPETNLSFVAFENSVISRQNTSRVVRCATNELSLAKIGVEIKALGTKFADRKLFSRQLAKKELWSETYSIWVRSISTSSPVLSGIFFFLFLRDREWQVMSAFEQVPSTCRIKWTIQVEFRD